MEMIEEYDFGRIVINGKRYMSDVIVFPDRVRANWWRREGHRLHIEDLDEVIREKPEVLVVGTGYSGLMEVPSETRKHLQNLGIQLIIQKTREACETYNQLLKSGRRAAAALHLTC